MERSLRDLLMIEFIDVHKSFGSKNVLNGLNLEIKKGEIFFILGRSGTGKSVLLKHLVGLLKPDSGKVLLEGKELQDASERDFQKIRKICSLVFQLPALLDSLNLFENLTFGIRDLPIKQQIQRAMESLESVGLHSLKDQLLIKYPPQLSYGEQKRVALARSLALDPEYILYDEPTTGLDPATSKAIHKLIHHVSTKLGKTSIVVSHDMANALSTATQIAILDGGKRVFVGTPEEVQDSDLPLARKFLGDLSR